MSITDLATPTLAPRQFRGRNEPFPALGAPANLILPPPISPGANCLAVADTAAIGQKNLVRRPTDLGINIENRIKIKILSHLLHCLNAVNAGHACISRSTA